MAVGWLWGGCGVAARTAVLHDDLLALSTQQRHDDLGRANSERPLGGCQATAVRPGGRAAASHWDPHGAGAPSRGAWRRPEPRLQSPRPPASGVTPDTSLTRGADPRPLLALFDKALRGLAPASRVRVRVGVAAHCAQGGCRSGERRGRDRERRAASRTQGGTGLAETHVLRRLPRGWRTCPNHSGP